MTEDLYVETGTDEQCFLVTYFRKVGDLPTTIRAQDASGKQGLFKLLFIPPLVQGDRLTVRGGKAVESISVNGIDAVAGPYEPTG